MVTAKFFRYAAEHVEEFDSIDAAAYFLAWGEDAGTLSSTDGEIRDGDRVIVGDELKRLVNDAWRRI